MKILLVDDEPQMLLLVSRQLARFGHSVECENSAEAALIRLGEFDALLSDVIMPNGRSGIEIAREARTRWPHLKIVLMSGFAEGFARESEFPILQKPFVTKDLEPYFGA